MKMNRFSIVEKEEIGIAEQMIVGFVEGKDWEIWRGRRSKRKTEKKGETKKPEESERRETHSAIVKRERKMVEKGRKNDRKKEKEALYGCVSGRESTVGTQFWLASKDASIFSKKKIYMEKQSFFNSSKCTFCYYCCF